MAHTSRDGAGGPAATVLAALSGLLATTLPATPSAEEGCRPAGNVTPICVFERPEDLEPLDVPAGHVLVSEYGSLDGSRTGRVSLLDLHSGTGLVLYPPDPPAPNVAGPLAGACPGPPGPGFSPHGIHLGDGPDGTPRLLTVNHGGREAVEIFDVDAGPDAVTLRWRDCVVAPPTVWMNDVVTLPGGGFAVTHMIARGTPGDAIHAAEHGREETGEVLSWFPGTGWASVPGSAGSLPNGIEASADGATLYVAYYFGDVLVALDRTSGRRVWETPIDAPDNLSWTSAGELLVAGHHVGLAAIEACGASEDPVCPIPYTIAAFDPATGARRDVLSGGDATFGGATVAVEAGGELLLGSFAGRRLARVRP